MLFYIFKLMLLNFKNNVLSFLNGKACYFNYMGKKVILFRAACKNLNSCLKNISRVDKELYWHEG